MKAGCGGLILLILSPVLLFFGYWGLARTEFRYRTTLEVETPNGVKSGSSVIRIFWIPGFGVQSTGGAYEDGEATFVDLGDGKFVIALLASGPKGNYGHRLAEAFFGINQLGYTRAPMIALAKQPIGTRVLLEGENIPTLVTFANKDNPQTARIIAPAGFHWAFGEGYTLKSASFELVHPGLWPINLLGLPWPAWLVGSPVTREIASRLPGVIQKLRQDDSSPRIERRNEPFRLRSGVLSTR